jgi:hypothetical protein
MDSARLYQLCQDAHLYGLGIEYVAQLFYAQEPQSSKWIVRRSEWCEFSKILIVAASAQASWSQQRMSSTQCAFVS